MTCDRLYQWLLYLYPADFREEYGHEMRTAYMVRARSESRIALWTDLFTDVVTTAPKEHKDVIIRDLIYAIRMLRRTAVVTAAVILTLALAIGANTAIFSVVKAVMLDPLPFPRPDRIVRIWETNMKIN